ncbi:MAG: Methylase of polypeptide chain release factor [Rickettsiales bacterium]|jgi:release factor glutamine methyltransferase|nr:Methylase of polypeptide chain release factor [Rickettsiales bacterium]
MLSSIQSTLFQAKQQLQKAGIPSFALDAELLLGAVLKVTREYILLHKKQPLTRDQTQAFEQLIARRIAREPMSHLLGTREFWSRDFIVTRDTLDPRPDSETVIDAVLRTWNAKHSVHPPHLLDMGTGTGCLLLTLLAEIPGSTGIGIDLSPAALHIATQNGLALGLEEHVTWRETSWNDASARFPNDFSDERFDIIISNPPYIPTEDIKGLEPEVRIYEPMLALDGGEDGLACYRNLIPLAAGWLKKGGLLALEIGQGQEIDVEAIGEAAGLKLPRLYPDLAGIIRCVLMER